MATTAEASASGVFLVARTPVGGDPEDTLFEVIAPTDVLAAQSRDRLSELQAETFSGIDLAAYIAAVAPRPVTGVCTAVEESITCVPVDAVSGENE